ncbi:MAG TPA: Ig-like domain-containing protein [Candidatus Angelobacter sp.]|nr:Ig-like domain-containing protein [Candidatus Angelobacter sp.]
MQRFRTAPLTIVVLACLLAAVGCGQFFPSSTTITALQVLPSNGTVAPGVTQQYTATATYGNNSTGDVTSQVTWSVTPTTYATITSGGLLTGVSLGTSTVQASSGSVIGSTGVTVTTKTVTSVTIQPLTQTLSVSGTNGPSTVQFTATATYQDGSMGNVTTNATWNALATPTGAVTISSSGIATASAVGTATVTATASGVTSNSATVTVVQ